MTFPDINRALATLLAPLVGGEQHTGIETPSNLQATFPFIRVARLGGGDDGVTDSPVVEVGYFDRTYDLAQAGAEKCRDLLASSPYHYVTYSGAGVLIDSVVTRTGPRQLPWPARDVYYMAATYAMETRRS